MSEQPKSASWRQFQITQPLEITLWSPLVTMDMVSVQPMEGNFTNLIKIRPDNKIKNNKSLLRNPRRYTDEEVHVQIELNGGI